MNICFICKYPPIQGGVSMHGYWAARGLAERGHNVYVVTNAEEVESTFRIEISERERLPDGPYAGRFTKGKVEVHSTTPPDRRSMYYIPMGNPVVSRLASKATDLIRRHRCEVVFSYYLEPYGLAAHLASHWTGIPYVFKHAGSDLYRLMPLEDLKTAYLEVLARANRVLSRGPSRKLLVEQGIDQDRISSDVAFGLPTEVFNSEQPGLDLNTMLREAAAIQQGDEADYTRPLRPDWPVLGIYGKLGEQKGSFDVLHALALLARNGFPVQLVALSRGWQEKRFRTLIKELGLEPHVRIHPFIPHWRIPSFIGACRAVAFLERDFAIAAHSPTIPTEILSCGGCLVVSEEVVRKQLFRNQVRDRRNLVVVPDPKDHEALARALRFALENGERSASMGEAGHALVAEAPSYRRYIDELEDLLRQVAKEAPVESCLRESQTEAEAPRDPVEITGDMYPYVSALLDTEARNRFKRMIQGSGLGKDSADRNGLARQIGACLSAAIEESHAQKPNPLSALAQEVCRYELKLHEWAKYMEDRASDAIKPQGEFPRDLDPLIPVLNGDWEIQEFTCDVEHIAKAVDSGEFDLSELDRPEMEEFWKTPLYVLFRQGSLPLRINAPTVLLLAMIDKGPLSVAELKRQITGYRGPTAADSQDDLDASIDSVIEGLYWEGALSFERALDLTG